MASIPQAGRRPQIQDLGLAPSSEWSRAVAARDPSMTHRQDERAVHQGTRRVPFADRAMVGRRLEGDMVFVIGAVLVVAALAALGLVLHRRGGGGLGDDTGAGRAPEEYRIPGGGGGNSGGLGA
jgi:hypothetical protein